MKRTKRVKKVLDLTVEAMNAVLQDIFPESVWDDSAHRTAERFVAYLREKKPQSTLDFNFTVFPSDVNHIVVIDKIEYSSLCKHHLLPFHGVAHVGYIPNKLLVGASKIPRLVNWWAKRPQTQELLTESIAHDMKDRLECQGVAVVMNATHTCISCRGVHKVGATMKTSCMLGVFITNPAAKDEFFNLLRL